MNHRSLATLAAAVVVAFAAACGGGEPAPTTPANPPPTVAPDTTPPVASTTPAATTPPVASTPPADTTPPAPSQPGAGDWDKWSHEQKLSWMKAGVMPKMGQAFHDFDAKAYADPKCGLCHGAGAKDGSFKMPNPDLPKLGATPADFKKLATGKKAKVFEFMMKTVEPQTAALIGEPSYDMKTGQGFGCFGCHTKK